MLFCSILEIVDGNAIRLRGGFQTLSSDDGGKTWEELPLPKETKDLITAADLSPDGVGFILLETGDLFSTADHGAAWAARRLPLGNKKINNDIYWSGASKIRFLNSAQGIAVVGISEPARGFVVYSTADGGLHWREERLPETGTGGKPVGTVFLSRDGKYLTINDIVARKIFLFERIQE